VASFTRVSTSAGWSDLGTILSSQRGVSVVVFFIAMPAVALPGCKSPKFF